MSDQRPPTDTSLEALRLMSSLYARTSPAEKLRQMQQITLMANQLALTAKLQHANIVPLFDSGEADGFLYYVMPYIEGESLRTRLEREKRLDVTEADVWRDGLTWTDPVSGTTVAIALPAFFATVWGEPIPE